MDTKDNFSRGCITGLILTVLLYAALAALFFIARSIPGIIIATILAIVAIPVILRLINGVRASRRERRQRAIEYLATLKIFL
jgi:Kef-type K+ transport system membrane component KefB